MAACPVGTIVITLLSARLVVATMDRDDFDHESLALQANTKGDVCRCHDTTLDCKLNEGFFSTSMREVKLGFCHEELQTARKNFEEAVKITDVSGGWTPQMKSQKDALIQTIAAFKAAIQTHIGHTAANIPDEEHLLGLISSDRGQAVLGHFEDKLKAAEGLVSTAELTEDKKIEKRLKDRLEHAIVGMNVKELEDAMREANTVKGNGNIDIWFDITRAQKRQNGLIEIKKKLQLAKEQTEAGQQELEAAAQKLAGVEASMQALQSIQDDLGDKAIAAMENIRKGVTLNDDEIRNRLAAVTADLMLDDSKTKLNELIVSADEMMTAIGARE